MKKLLAATIFLTARVPPGELQSRLGAAQRAKGARIPGPPQRRAPAREARYRSLTQGAVLAFKKIESGNSPQGSLPGVAPHLNCHKPSAPKAAELPVAAPSTETILNST